MSKKLHLLHFHHISVVVSLLAAILGSYHPAGAQTSSAEETAQRLLEIMSPQERVGQLFLVSFAGMEVGEDSQIYDLIANHHIGGVVLLAENDNFLGEPDTITGAQQLINSLQAIEAEANQATPEPNAPAEDKIYVPMFIGFGLDFGLGRLYAADHGCSSGCTRASGH